MTKIECPTCRLRYWDYEKAANCCKARREREDAEVSRKKNAEDIERLLSMGCK